MKIAIAAALVGSLAGCAAPVREVQLDEPFDQAATAELLRPGPNTVTGSGLIRQVGGGVVTCAGNRVTLIPATSYSRKRMAAIYGPRRFARPQDVVNFRPNPPEYQQTARVTACNAQGFFRFDNVADGEFFVVTTVIWHPGPYATEGGALYSPVAVKGGQAVEIVLTP
jgi:hypothetical protein